MSNIIFPADYILDLSDLNIEMMQYYSKQWSMEHTIMEKGLFKGSISAVHTPRIQLASAYYSQSIMTKGDFPDGCVVLAYPQNDVIYNFQNRTIKSNEIIVMSKGDEIDILTSGELIMQTIVIEEQLFNQSFYNFFGSIPCTMLNDKRFSIKPDMISVLEKIVGLWSDYLINKFPSQTIQPTYNRIESEILHQLFSCLMFTPTTKKRKKFNTKTVRDLLHSNIDQFIDISDITNELTISESQLHYAFKEDYGITPKKYLQHLRFNAIRKELLLAHPHSAKIVDIAQKYNFFHMSPLHEAHLAPFVEQLLILFILPQCGHSILIATIKNSFE